MDSKEKGTQIINEHSDNLIIYRPKPKKICISHNMVKHSHNKNKNVNKKHYPLTPVLNINFNFNNEIKQSYKNKNESKIKANKNSKFDFDKISLEEIDNDFTKLKARDDAYKEEKELLYLLRNSTKDNSQEDNIDEIKRVKRPKRPILENIE